MPRPKEVKITKDDQEASVLKESVPAYERLGWTVADDGSSEDEAPAEDTTEKTPAKKTTTRKAD